MLGRFAVNLGRLLVIAAENPARLPLRNPGLIPRLQNYTIGSTTFRLSGNLR
jgi:hypothetical protein